MEKPFRKHTADRILIVDDEVATCEVLARRLSKEGYSCLIAHNGKEALHHFYKENISLMIPPIQMPDTPTSREMSANSIRAAPAGPFSGWIRRKT